MPLGLNQIVAERPLYGSEVEPATPGRRLYRIWQKLPGGLFACHYAVNSGDNANRWTGWQVPTLAVGRPRSCTSFRPGHAAYSFPDTTTWATSTVTGEINLLEYRAPSAVKRLRWTAPADYAAVVVTCMFHTSFSDLTIAATLASGILLTNLVDCHTVASPFGPAASYMTIDQRHLTIATGVKAGDVIDFSSVSGVLNSIRLRELVGLGALTADPADTECVLLGRQFLVAGDVSLDGSAALVCDQAQETGRGQNAAIDFHGTSAHGPAGYWGSPPHADSNNNVLAAGTANLPASALMVFTDAALAGTAWAPALGARDVVQALTLTMTGEPKIIGTACTGSVYDELYHFSSAGYAWAWNILFGATLPASLHVDGGYSAMLEVSAAPQWLYFPGQAGPRPLVLDDDSFSAYVHAPRALVYGGALGRCVLEFVPALRTMTAPNQLCVQERITYAANKLYVRYSALTHAAPLTIAAGVNVGGGARVALLDQAVLETVGLVSGRGLRIGGGL